MRRPAIAAATPASAMPGRGSWGNGCRAVGSASGSGRRTRSTSTTRALPRATTSSPTCTYRWRMAERLALHPREGVGDARGRAVRIELGGDDALGEDLGACHDEAAETDAEVAEGRHRVADELDAHVLRANLHHARSAATKRARVGAEELLHAHERRHRSPAHGRPQRATDERALDVVHDGRT